MGFDLGAKIERREARVAVMGLGFVGLPLACAFAEAGFGVSGYDVDAGRVEAVLGGFPHTPDVSPETLRELVNQRRLAATTDPAVLAGADAIVICVPTPLRKTRDPDISFIIAAAEEVAHHLHAGCLVVLESTTYPGTTEETVRPILERTGLRAGADFHLAFSPERFDPGNPTYTLRNTPKVVGGATRACTDAALRLYRAVSDEVVAVRDTTTAEMAKLLENTYRAVNVGLVNELCVMCDRLGIDVWEVIEAAATKPFGFTAFYPGPGLGGHCIPVDPQYLSWKLRSLDYRARFIELAEDVNRGMPAFVVEKVTRMLNRARKPVAGSRILIVGLAYKANVGDVRESPGLDILRMLEAREAAVAYHDALVPEVAEGGRVRASVASSGLKDEAARSDLVILVTVHEETDVRGIVRHARSVLDCRNATRGIEGAGKVVKL